MSKHLPTTEQKHSGEGCRISVGGSVVQDQERLGQYIEDQLINFITEDGTISRIVW